MPFSMIDGINSKQKKRGNSQFIVCKIEYWNRFVSVIFGFQ